MVPFEPPALIRGGHLQSALASSGWRQRRLWRRTAADLAGTRPGIVDGGAGVRLLVEHTPPPPGRAGRMAVLIHGWEGSASSTYMLSLAARLARDGYRVLRLNLRDHGDSHHLNEELFHSCRLDEVVHAVRALQQGHPGERLFLGGFSLGGNFALRVAAAAGEAGLVIEKALAICPVLEPRSTLAALDGGLPAYRLHFIRKWRRSLERKRAAFPQRYDFGELGRFRDLRAMTDYFVRHYTEFADLDSYLDGYALTGGRLGGLEVTSEILLADDDPVIPVGDVTRLARPPALSVRRSRYGGHCGFIANYRLESWLDDYAARFFGA